MATTTNLEVLQQTHIKPLTAYIRNRQMKLLGQVLRRDNSDLNYDVCFTSAYVYRCGAKGDRRRGALTENSLEDVARFAWHLVQHMTPSLLHNSTFSQPYCYLQLSRVAADREYRSFVANLPTSMETQSIEEEAQTLTDAIISL